MKAQEIKDQISAGLNLKLIPENFSYKKSTNAFKRVVGDFTHVFAIDQLAWSDHFSLNVRLYISERRIEDMLQKILGKQRHRLTLGGDIAKIKSSPDGRKVINDTLTILLLFEEDIPAAVESLYDYYENIGGPFFQRYDSLEAIDDILNNEPYSSVPAHVAGTYDSRCIKGLIVAKLVSSPRFEELIAIYDEEMKMIFKDFRQEAIQDYQKVRDYLTDKMPLRAS